MGMPRTPVSELKLRADKNIKRSLSYSATRKAVLAHRAELEQMWQDLSERRADALAEIKRDGLTVTEERWSRGKNISVLVTHPALAIAQDCERQLKSLARLLSMVEESESKEMSDAELLAATDHLEMN